jgi:hypothetical protein
MSGKGGVETQVEKEAGLFFFGPVDGEGRSLLGQGRSSLVMVEGSRSHEENEFERENLHLAFFGS